MSSRDPINHSSSSLRPGASAHRGWSGEDAVEIDRRFGLAAARSARLDRELDLPLHARFLPPDEHFKLTERHVSDTLRAQGAENTHNLVAWQQTHDLAEARAEQEELRATGSMYESARAYARGGQRGSSSTSSSSDRLDNVTNYRKAHADFARYQAHAAEVGASQAVATMRALYIHRTTPLEQRVPLWYAVEAQLKKPTEEAPSS